jgi:3-oxoacyl-[acyl-carrier-protein] synthase-3
MNGRAVFNFTAMHIPNDIRLAAQKNDLTLDDIDLFLLHQGSRYIVETIGTRLALPSDKVPFGSSEYGNTVSSSIPILLADQLAKPSMRTILLSGFGLGFSWASTVLRRSEA